MHLVLDFSTYIQYIVCYTFLATIASTQFGLIDVVSPLTDHNMWGMSRFANITTSDSFPSCIGMLRGLGKCR